MRFCSKCGAKQKDEVAFCTMCGTFLGSAHDRKKNQRADFAQKNKAPITPSPSTSTLPAEIKLPLHKLISIYFIAGSKSLIMTSLISALVLLPGLLLMSQNHLQGVRLLGMIWLFLGAFAMMAWNYRKPWKLHWITCLLPPIGAGLCYALQLILFVDSKIALPGPPIAIALFAGFAIGLLRGSAHKVYVEGPFVMARRTFGYLFVWVIAYGITQFLGVWGVRDFALNAGLITGAFTTAMFSAVSFALLIKKQLIPRSGVTTVLLLLFSVLSFIPGSIDAAEKVCGKYEVSIKTTSKEWKRTGFVFYFRELPNNRAVATISFTNKAIEDQFDELAIKLLLTPTDIEHGMVGSDSGGQYIFSDVPIHTLAFIYFRLFELIAEGLDSFAENFFGDSDSSGDLPVTKVTISKETYLSVSPRENKLLLKLHIIGTIDGNSLEVPIEIRTRYLGPIDRTPAKLGWSDYIESNNGTGDGEFEKFIADFGELIRDDGKDNVTPPDPPPVDDDDKPEPPPIEEKIGLESAETAAIIAAGIFIAAGFGVSFANNTAIAIAQEIQAEVEATADQLANSSAEHQDDTLASPPIVNPYEQQPFEQNEHGEYMAPDEKGNWRWMGHSDASSAAEALQQELSQRETEQRHHDRETEKILNESREKIQAQHRQEEEDYLNRKLQQEQEAAAQIDRDNRLVVQAKKMAAREGGSVEEEINQLVEDDNYAGLEDLYRGEIKQQMASGQEESASAQSWDKTLAVGEYVSLATVAAAKGALMVAGGPAGAAATGLAVGSISAAEESAESYVRGDPLGKVVAKTASGFLSGAKDGAISVYSNLPGTGAASKLLIPAGADAAETYVRTSDGKQALVSAGLSVVGDLVGGKVDAMGNVAGRELGRATLTVAAAELSNYAAGGKLGDAYQTALVNHLGGKIGGLAGKSLVNKFSNEQSVREALSEVQATKKAIPIEEQAKIVQELNQSRYKEVVTDESGRPKLDINGDVITTEFVNTRKALEQVGDTASSRSAKMGPENLKQAIIETRQKKIYDPADAKTIRRVLPALEQAGLLKPGDEVVMDSFSTPGKKPSLGADRDARLVIKRPNGKPVTDKQDGFDRIEIKRKHWEDVAHEEFFKHTTKIAESGGQKITPESHPEYFRRRAEMEFMKRPDSPEAIAEYQARGYSEEKIARLQQQGMTQEQIDHKAWAEAHNQLFTDKHHMEASADNADQAFAAVDRSLKKVQIESNILLVGKGEGTLHDPEGFARMWGEKSRFYSHTPTEAIAQSQKGIAGLLETRDGYRAQNFTPPPFTEQTAKAMVIVAKAKVDASATPETIAIVDQKLKDLGYKDLNDALAKIAYQNELLKGSTKGKILGSSDLIRISQPSVGFGEDDNKEEGA